MKKLFFLLCIGGCIFMGGCAHVIKPTLTATPSTASVLLSGKISQYPFTRKMEKPASAEITNIESMQSGFQGSRTKTLSTTDITPDQLDILKKCPAITVVNNDNGSIIKNITRPELEKGNVEITGQYNGPGLGFTLTPTQKTFLYAHGWLVFKPGDNRNMRADGMALDQEEWGLYYQKIGGQTSEYRRYPYNTIFITTDIMLHLYHKIFSNSLRYYEESSARTTMAELSVTMFDKFAQLYKQNATTPLAPYYAYAAAYRSIPYALFIPADEVTAEINKEAQNNTTDQTDLSDQEIQTMSLQRLASIQGQIPQAYQAAVQSTMKNIFDASDPRAADDLLDVLAGPVASPITIQQDYTQFTPRSHYTDSSLLKTYFMGMKRFMREKLYFRDSQQATTALIMINNIQNKELEKFSVLYDFIKKLIGEDDDVNIKDIQTFISTKGWTSDQAIAAGITKNTQDELTKIRPQKITSTHYQTPETQMVTEQQAKDELAGFVFFGEKFTIDSRIFDRMTAGSAEKESTYKPSVQTSLIVPDALVNTGFIRDLVNLRMQQAQSKYKITAQQVAGYDQAKQEAQSGIFNFDFSVSTYHQWLSALGRLFAISDPKRPYFMQDPLRQYKNLNTFQGNYTELKHDTLLYVKQAYAEMGNGGNDECTITITPPPLPVPKGYVEPNVDLIDALLTLTDQTKDFFGDNESYTEFTKFLSFIKDIAVKETKNETIDDTGFETLRLYYSDLLSILYPQKVIEGGDNDFISAIIADIFTSENDGPLYIATGRPDLLITDIKDANGTRAVIGPVYSTYEFYGSDNPISAQKGRYTDIDWRSGLDALSGNNNLYTLPMQKILQQ